MGNVDAFLKSLLAFDKDNVPLACADRAEKEFISNPAFNADNIRTKSGAAAGLCAWVINICKYFRIYQARAAPRRPLLPREPCRRTGRARRARAGPRARRWSRPSARRWRRPTASWTARAASWPPSARACASCRSASPSWRAAS